MNKKFEDFNMNDFVASNTPQQDIPTKHIVEEKEIVVEKSTKKTVTGKQRKASLLEYQQTFLSIPKITDRKTVFISNELRECIVEVVRKLGSEKSSVSGFIENMVSAHLSEYKEDIESWKKL